MGNSWYTIRTKPQSENISATGLERQGFEVFLPCVKSSQPRNGRSDTPFFPGYLFLNCDLDSDDVPSFGITPHVLGWVTFGDEIPSIHDQAVAALAERLDVINKEGGLWSRFETGEKVEVVAGYIQGFAQVVAGAKSPEDRVKILIEFMGRTVTARVPWENLRSTVSTAQIKPERTRRTRGRRRWIRGNESRAQAIS